MPETRHNAIVIGGGIVGLAVALEITRRFPQLRLLVLEKEDRVARHQSGHNSGVIHAGPSSCASSAMEAMSSALSASEEKNCAAMMM